MVSAVSGASPESILSALDPEQLAVATTFNVPVYVIAGAGTGKTRAVTHRIAYGAATGQLDPRRTLAVTFTNRAAGTMKGRLAELGVSGVQARTIHSAALRQIQHFWPRAYGCELPPVSDHTDALLAEASRRIGLGGDRRLVKDLSTTISWAKVCNITPEEYPSLARARNRVVAGVSAADVARVMVAYEAIKRERCVVDFNDILLCAVGLMSQHRDIAVEIRSRYQHFVVDEYQDISPIQHRLLELWFGDRNDICVVGDPHQVIHAYAGARAEYLLRFPVDHPGARRVDLVRNYRSTPQIVRLANAVLTNNLDPDEAGEHTGGVELVARGRSGPEPVHQVAQDDAAEAAAIAMWLQTRHEAGTPWGEMAVLYRSNFQSAVLETALGTRSVPYLVKDSEMFFARPEVRQVVTEITRLAATQPGGDALASVDRILAGRGWSEDPPKGNGSARKRWEALLALRDLARDAAAEGAGNLAGLAGVFQRRAETEEAPVGHGVTLATMHAAKGLEWDAVALYGLDDATVPSSRSETPSEIAAERRLLHVGITRARRDLWLSHSLSSSGRANRGVSRFLRGLPGVPEEEPRHGRRRRRPAPAVCSVCGGPLTAARDRKLSHHLACEVGVDPDLVDRLREWRHARAEKDRVPAFVVLTDATLLGVAERRPDSVAGLLAVPGIGQRKARLYAADLIDVLHEFSEH